MLHPHLSPSYSPPFFPHHHPTQTPFPKLPFPPPKFTSFKIIAHTSSPSQAVSESEESNSLPCVRTYENDSAKLSLTGSVNFDQALTAASADGGEAASEHIEAGLDVMVVETLFPGPTDLHSTVSTRLFLPARKVKEKARKLRGTLPKDLLSGTNSRNILAMTFRQVVVQRLLNFDLAVFVPESQRNMEDLGTEREVTVSFALSASDESVISGIAEAVCILALETTQREFHRGSARKVSDGFFRWFSNSKKFTSKNSSVILYRFDDEVMIEMAESLLDKFNFSNAKFIRSNGQPTKSPWTSVMHSKLEKIGGFEFSMWASEHVPAYRIEIDADRLSGLNFEGWRKTTGNKWEVVLTHSQMVGLSNVLDMYFEDLYTLPSKQLSHDAVRIPQKLLKSKGGFSLLGFLRTTLVAASLLVSFGMIIKLFSSHVYSSRRRYDQEYSPLASSENYSRHVQTVRLEASELEAYCSAIIKKLKDSYSWSGVVQYEPSVGAWIGDIPAYLKDGYVAESIGQDVSASSDKLIGNDQNLKSSVQNIATYQVVLSSDGRIVGFQPTSRVAVNHWAANPIAKELYGGKELSPGLLEPGLKMYKPENVLTLELLMSLNKDDHFALARAVQ